MADFGNTSKRSGDDAGGRSKRQRLEPAQGHNNMRTLLQAAGLGGESTGHNVAQQQGLGHAHRAGAPPAVSDPIALYRHGRYMPTEAGHHQMPIPQFLRGQLAHEHAQQAQESGDPRSPGLFQSLGSPPRQAPRSSPVNQRPADGPQSNVKAVRVCPQCREVPLGPGPIVNGEPTYPVCESCRQTNIRRQVLKGTAAQALVELSQRVTHQPPKDNDLVEDVRGRAPNGLGPLPKRHQQFACLRCKRPGVPLAPGRRRCVECICILIAFGPDEGEEQAAADASQRQKRKQKKQPAGLEQQQPQDEHFHMCDGCFNMPVPPGERKCPECVTKFDQMHRALDMCVICEQKRAVRGQSYCGDCEVRSTRSLGAATMPTPMVCSDCGYYFDSTGDEVCWGCRITRSMSESVAESVAAVKRGKEGFYAD